MWATRLMVVAFLLGPLAVYAGSSPPIIGVLPSETCEDLNFSVYRSYGGNNSEDCVLYFPISAGRTDDEIYYNKAIMLIQGKLVSLHRTTHSVSAAGERYELSNDGGSIRVTMLVTSFPPQGVPEDELDGEQDTGTLSVSYRGQRTTIDVSYWRGG